MRDKIRKIIEYNSFWRGTGKDIVYRDAYKNHEELYNTVAKFCTELQDKLITISGTPWGENFSSYEIGDVVVWYKE